MSEFEIPNKDPSRCAICGSSSAGTCYHDLFGYICKECYEKQTEKDKEKKVPKTKKLCPFIKQYCSTDCALYMQGCVFASIAESLRKISKEQELEEQENEIRKQLLEINMRSYYDIMMNPGRI